MSLDGDALGEVAGLVDVAALEPGHVVGQKLQGDDGEQGLDDLGDIGNGQENVGKGSESLVALGADGDHRAIAGADLFDVGEGLGVQRAARSDEDGGSGRVDQRNRAMLHLGCGIALSVDVADLLEFQGPFESDGVVQVASEKQDAAGGAEVLGSAGGQGFEGKGAIEGAGGGFEGVEHGQAVSEGEVSNAGQVQGQEREHGDLGSEALGAGDADLGTGVEVDAADGLTGDRGADDVADGERGVAAAAGFAECAQGIGRLAGLGQDKDEGVIVERGVAVAELTGVLDLDRQVGQALDQVLADQCSMPARAAGGEDDAPDTAQAGGREIQAAQDGSGFGAVETAAAGVSHGDGLLMDFLAHVVLERAQFGGVGGPVDAVDARGDWPALPVADLEAVGGEAHDLAILQERNLGGVGSDGGGIAGEKMFAITNANDQRAAQSCTDDLAGGRRTEHGESIGAFEARQNCAERRPGGRGSRGRARGPSGGR